MACTAPLPMPDLVTFGSTVWWQSAVAAFGFREKEHLFLKGNVSSTKLTNRAAANWMVAGPTWLAVANEPERHGEPSSTSWTEGDDRERAGQRATTESELDRGQRPRTRAGGDARSRTAKQVGSRHHGPTHQDPAL